jgi:hypothetical protein
MWSYFVLATLRWFTPPPAGANGPPPCWLCDPPVPDTIDHFLVCPGLRGAHEMVNAGLQHQFDLLGIDLPAPLTFLSPCPLSLPHSQPQARQGSPAIALRLIEQANLSDKQAAIAGFLPLSVRSLIKLYRPHTYRQDFEDFRLCAIDLCARRYDVYRREVWRHWLASSDPR